MPITEVDPSFPLADRRRGAAPTPPGSHQAANHGVTDAKQILLVEDSKVVGTLLGNKLCQAGFKVVWVESMAKAMAVLDLGRTDFFCAVLDFSLPDAPDGEIIPRLVARDIPSLVFTGNLSNTVRELAWGNNVVDYVLKDNPFAYDYIVATVRRLERNLTTKVLVVDDSTFSRQMMADLLRVQLLMVYTAGNGREAMAVLDEHPDIKLVITDFHMPEMDGFKLTQSIRQRASREEVAIVGISSDTDRTMAARFIKYGANDFIIKQSFLAEEFYSRVNQCLDDLENIRRLRDAAVRDFLTGLYNRRYFFDFGHKLFANAARKNITLTCAMIDIDYFKRVNDTYGHDVGDVALRHIADILAHRLRESDLVARIGGEEFCVLAVNVDAASVRTLCEELRQRVADSPLKLCEGQSVPLTVSIGVAVSGDAFSLEEMVKRADERLYRAKQSGRNRVVCS